MNTIPDHLPEIAPPVLATERKPVDVVGWCREAATAIDRIYGPQAQLPKELDSVIAAMADLIDCVGDARNLLAEIDSAVRTEHAKNGHPKSQSIAGIINARLSAALARCGGAG